MSPGRSTPNSKLQSESNRRSQNEIAKCFAFLMVISFVIFSLSRDLAWLHKRQKSYLGISWNFGKRVSIKKLVATALVLSPAFLEYFKKMENNTSFPSLPCSFTGSHQCSQNVVVSEQCRNHLCRKRPKAKVEREARWLLSIMSASQISKTVVNRIWSMEQ
ncbi:hypothetical protein TNCV_2231481 [Trichonephila clavipes]|nr:hypothetical protein TNCV_2231481 [Trichonephila clavipes]